MAREPEFVLEYLKQVESLADDVLADRRDIIELNKKRDKSREASRALKKSVDAREPGERTWVCCGNLFIGFTKQEAASLIEKDYQKFDTEINRLHKGLKQKVYKLYDAEKKPEIKGFDLVPLSQEQKDSLNELVGDK